MSWNNNPKTAVFYTLGCKANQYQSFALQCQMTNDKPARHARQGVAGGCQMVDFGQPADLYVINTCLVTEDAERKSRQAIRRALRLGKKVVVSGCYAKLMGDKLKEMFPEITLTPLIPLSIFNGEGETRREGVRIRANLMVQDGCEHFCSYCIVPFARGKVASKPADQVIAEAKQLVNAGAREIILTGINLGTYQHDLSSVIRRLSSVPGLLRIRISSVEPMYLTRELIDTVAQTPKACRHFHIPLQSGDNRILKAMRRNYTAKDYLEIIDYIRSKIPDCGISTDIIVGFPGEGEIEFGYTLHLIKRAKFSRLHIFPYSKRRGTAAADFPGQVDIATKKQRSKILLGLNIEYMREFAEQYLGKEVEILVEQKGEGITSNYIRCYFNDPRDSSGNFRIIFVKSVNNSGEIRE